MKEIKGCDFMATDYQFDENDRKTRLLLLYELQEAFESMPGDASIADALALIQEMKKALREPTSKR